MTNAQPQSNQDVIAAFMDGADKLMMFAEATAGYRKKLIDGGVGPDAADAMAKDFHDVLMEQIRANITTPNSSRWRQERKSR